MTNLSMLVNDMAHWHGMKPPLSPNKDEVFLYQEYINGKNPVCLLGMTKELVPFCHVAVDLNPIEIGKPTIKSDWNDLTGNFKVVIGDGVINLAGMELVDRMLKISERFICRVFMAKQPGMKYATYFPTSFPRSSLVITTQPDIAFVVWDQ